MGTSKSCDVLLRPSQSSIFLEHIVQYYFTPQSDSNGVTQCLINEPYATRHITQLYSSFTKYLPAAAFFRILLSSFYELDPTVWAFRAVSHLYRHLDQDFHLSILVVSSMARHLSFLLGDFQYSSVTFDASLSTQVVEKLTSRAHDLVQRFPADLSATSHDLLLDLTGALGELVNSDSVQVLSTKIGEALLALCLTASVINEVRHSEILHALKTLEKVASPRLFTSLVLRTSLVTFDHITGCWLSTLRSYHLINLAKALEHAVASFHAGDVDHRRPYKCKRKQSSEPGPSHDSDEWEARDEPGRGKAKHRKVKARHGSPSESSVSGLEDAGRRKRVKRPRVKVTYQPSENGTEDDSPIYFSANEGSSEAHDRDKEAEDKFKPAAGSTKENAVTRPLESSHRANAQRSTSCQPLTKRGHSRSSSRVPLPQLKQIIESSQSQSATPLEIRPVSSLRTSSTARQETHRSRLSSDDDLDLFACSSPR